MHSLAAEYGVHAAFACEAAPDAGVLAGLCDTLAAALDESGQRKLLDEMELPLARVLADMERIGFAIDADGIRAFGDSLRGELDGILNNIYTTVGYPFNVNSPKQLGEALFDKLGLPPRKKNARGYSTDAETLESLRPYNQVIDEILKYRTYAKLLSTYVDGLLNAEAADGRPTRPSSRPRHAPGASPPPSRTCRTFPSVPSWAAACAVTLWRARARHSWTPTTRRSSCAFWRTSQATSTCSRRF